LRRYIFNCFIKNVTNIQYSISFVNIVFNYEIDRHQTRYYLIANSLFTYTFERPNTLMIISKSIFLKMYSIAKMHAYNVNSKEELHVFSQLSNRYDMIQKWANMFSNGEKHKWKFIEGGPIDYILIGQYKINFVCIVFNYYYT